MPDMPQDDWVEDEAVECPICRTMVDWDEVRCPNCGANLRTASSGEPEPFNPETADDD